MNNDRLAARLRATFAAELGEQVEAMNRVLLALEAEPTEPAGLRSLFRVAHTLKGAARTADVPPVEELCHTLETMLVEARDGRRILGPAEFAALFAAADALAESSRQLGSEQPVDPARLEPLIARFRVGWSEGSAVVPGAAMRAADTPAPPRHEVGDQRLRVDPSKLDALLASSSQLLIAGSRVAERPAEIDALHDSAKELLAGWRRARRQLRGGKNDDGRLSQMVDWVDARVLALAQEARRLAASTAGDARALEQVTVPMLEQVRRLRVRPFSEACEALPRAARDLAAAAGKEVTLEIIHGGVEADRLVLDVLRDALLQLLRNAVDHGIESPDRRVQLGKPSRGTVRIAAELRGDRIQVTVADDGAGLDEPAIRSRLAVAGRPDPADRFELVRALLEGGTSTRTEAGRISGRGVGLDIVRTAVERIHGRLEVDWTAGRGTTFTLLCPPSTATIRAMLVRVGTETVALPTADVATAVIKSSDAVRRAAGRNTIATPDGPVPLVSLASLLGPAFVPAAADTKVVAVVVRSGDRRLALAVDELLAEQEIMIRPIPGREGRFPLLSGAALLASGQVALVLDPVYGIEAAAGVTPGAGAQLEGGPGADGGRKRQRILVVEDSITTRTLEQSILEAAGYEVATAVDGVDGLRWLQERRCDVVVADVDMPRMDGIALCRAVRASPQLKKLPFVLLTARESAEDRARGLEAGADAYLGKSSFDQDGLLEAVRQLIG
jgi:two-component system chemotaxis sensor kinase CheA